jgi:hypothetical protein
MNNEIKEYQDKMVGFVLEAKVLQSRSDVTVGLSLHGGELVPVDSILKSLYTMTTRRDLKEKIEEALLTNPTPQDCVVEVGDV